MITRGLGNPSALVTRGLGGFDVRVVPPWWFGDRVGYSPQIVPHTATVLHTARPVTHTSSLTAATAAPVAYLPAPVAATADPSPVVSNGDVATGDDVDYSPDEVPHTRLVPDGPTWSP